MLENETSMKLLYAVRAHTIVSHIHQARPMTDISKVGVMLKTCFLDRPIASKANTADHLAVLSVEIPNLRMLAEMSLKRPKIPSTVLPVLQLIKQCGRLDAAFSKWSVNVPEGWKYTTTSSTCAKIPSETCPGQMHVYPDVWT